MLDIKPSRTTKTAIMSDNVLVVLQRKLTLLQTCIREERLAEAVEVEKALSQNLKTIFSDGLIQKQSDYEQLLSTFNSYSDLVSKLIELQCSTRDELVTHTQGNKKLLIYKQFR